MAETSETVSSTTGCHYEMAGQLCGAVVRARGYCRKHYMALNRRGAFDAGRPLQPGAAITEAQVERNIGHLDRARLLLQQHTEELVGILIEAARKAAKRGDSKPAEWALLHSRTLEPVLTGGAAARPGAKEVEQGVRVIIGVQLTSNGAPATVASTCTSTSRQAIQTSDQQTSSQPAEARMAGLPSLPAIALPVIDTVLVEPGS